MAKNITPRKENFPKWYQDAITAGELADNSPVRGCMVIRPVGFALWERMQEELDRRFKETGHSNAFFPLLIPEHFITKEAEHVEGFSPELAMVTHAGGKELEERLVIRPTSETIIGAMYSKWVKSYRDLPVLINQWCNVMRWEMRPRIFLRTSEFLWQEGHTVHETPEEAQAETLKMLGVYKEFLENVCAIPVITGLKPEHEKFPGAISTYTLEAMMQDKKALQSGTSHNLGQNFSKAFDIKFLDRENRSAFGWTTSWGVSTRMIGGLIMTHGDDDGIVVPPRLAPVQAVVIPIFKKDAEKQGVTDFAEKIFNEARETLGGLRVKMDEQFNLRPGDRFFHWIQRGVPLRVEIGPKDVENGNVLLVRRDTREKILIPADRFAESLKETLEQIQQSLFQNAKNFRDQNSPTVESAEEFAEAVNAGAGFIYAHWDGAKETALKVQQKHKTSIRVLPDHLEDEPGRCVFTGKPSARRVIFAQSY